VALLLTAITITVNSAFANLSRSFGRSLVATFFPDDYSNINEAFVSDFSYYVFTVPDAQNDVQRLLLTYNTLPDVAVSPIEHTSQAPAAVISDIRGRRRTYHPRGDNGTWVSEDSTTAQIQDFLSDVVSVTFRFHLRSRPQTVQRACYNWKTDFTYDLSALAHFTVTCTYKAISVCDGHGRSDSEVATKVLTAAAVAFSAVYEVLLARSALQQLPSWSMWGIVSQLGASCTLLFGFYSLLAGEYVETKFWLKFLLGLGCLVQYVSLVQFFESRPRYYVLVLTLKRGIPRVAQFLLGACPLFFGFMLLGMILFGDQCDGFGDLGSTAATLFAVVNGDVLLDTFAEVSAVPVIGQIYIYCYVFLFMYVVLMTIIAIVEEAFFSSSRDALESGDGGTNRHSRGSAYEDMHPLDKADDSVFEKLSSVG
jgi:hypothetical protein